MFRIKTIKKLLLTTIIIFQSCTGQGQEKVELDFIIMINDKLCYGLSSMKIKSVSLDDDSNLNYLVDYHPGNLSIDSHAYNELIGKNTDSLYLIMDYSIHSLVNDEGRSDYYHYQIPMGKIWLKNTYMVLKIYNLDEEKYNERFEPIGENMNYTFELDYPGGSMKRIPSN